MDGPDWSTRKFPMWYFLGIPTRGLNFMYGVEAFIPFNISYLTKKEYLHFISFS